MGDYYATALSKGLKHMSPELINVADNRLSQKGSKAIVSKLNPALKYLNISQNKIDVNTAILLGRYVKGKCLKYNPVN